jgi:cytochrome P450
MIDVPDIDLSDPEVLTDPFTAYGRARERGPVARLVTPGFGSMWAVTRYDDAKAMLTDPRLHLTDQTYLRLDVPEHCRKYLRTMQGMDGAEHARLRRLASPAFTARRAERLRPRIARIVDALLEKLTGEVDLLTEFARPLPIDVICELVGIPNADRGAWREYGLAIATGNGATFTEAVPAIIRDAAAVIERHQPGTDLLADLIGGQADADELITLVWHLVLAGQVPTHLIGNALDALARHPDQLAALRADESLLPRGVEELTRWCGPQLLSLPRFAQEDLEIGGVPIAKGEPVLAALACANRDPRVFTDPERLDLRRPISEPAHLGYAHGPHYCLGAALARVQVQVALGAFLRRFGTFTVAAHRVPDPGAWRFDAVTVTVDD